MVRLAGVFDSSKREIVTPTREEIPALVRQTLSTRSIHGWGEARQLRKLCRPYQVDSLLRGEVGPIITIETGPPSPAHACSRIARPAVGTARIDDRKRVPSARQRLPVFKLQHDQMRHRLIPPPSSSEAAGRCPLTEDRRLILRIGLWTFGPGGRCFRPSLFQRIQPGELAAASDVIRGAGAFLAPHRGKSIEKVRKFPHHQ
jgi:hypothetical protein